MDTRLQQALDGELTAAEMTRDELAELRHEEALIQSVLLAIPADPVPDLRQAVLREIAASEPEPTRPWLIEHVREAWSLVWQPRPVALRPAYALAAAALVGVLILGRGNAPVPAAVPPATVTTASPVLIQFRLDAPDAQQVSLAGDFTGWKAEYQLVQSSSGVWTIVVPLNQGMHEYAFIIDGEQWVSDPLAPAVQDGFGGMNSKVAVIAPDTRSL